MAGGLDRSHTRRLFLAALISGATVWPLSSPASETLVSDSDLLRRERLRGHTDAEGNVRPDLWLRGLEQARRLPVAPGLRRVESGLEASESVGGGGRWFPIGPTSLRLSRDDTRNTGMGPNAGLIADIAIDPRGTTDQVLYLATQGGVWKTLDGGASWAPLTDAMPSLSVGSVAVDPDEPDTVYAGTGFRLDPKGYQNYRPAGLYRSRDGGGSWDIRGTNLFASRACDPTRTLGCGRGIYRIIAPPSPGKGLVLVATNDGLFVSDDYGEHFGTPPLYDDDQPILAGEVFDIDLDTSDPDTVYASVRDEGVFKVSIATGTFGNLFLNPGAPASATFTWIVFAQASPPDGQTMYALVTTNGHDASIYKSTNGGGDWMRAAATGLGSCQCNIDQIIGVDPNDAARVYVGLVELWVSSNGGDSFDWAGANEIHPDQVALAFSPASHPSSGSKTGLWVGNHGGLVFSSDGGMSWEHPDEGLGIASIVSVDMGRGSPEANQYTYAGMWDNGTAVRRPGDPGTEWYVGMNVDGGAVAVDPNNARKGFGVANFNLLFTRNGGEPWEGLAAPCDTIGLSGCKARAIAIDPSTTNAVGDSEVVYVIGQTGTEDFNQLYRSDDGGLSYTPICSRKSYAQDVAVSWTDPNKVWVTYGDGTIRRIDDARTSTGTCTEFDNPLLSGGFFDLAIVIDPLDERHVVVVVGNYTGLNPAVRPTRHVWQTLDEGQTWADISGVVGGLANLPDLPVNDVVIDPGTFPQTVIVGNDAGVFATADDGATWKTLGTDLPVAFQMGLALDWTAEPPILRTGAYGRSVFELGGPRSDLRLALIADPPEVLPGGQLTYTVSLGSLGPDAMRQSHVTVELSAGQTVAAASDCSVSGNRVACDVGVLGCVPFCCCFVRIIFITATVAQAPPLFLTATATIEGRSPEVRDTVPENNRASVLVYTDVDPCDQPGMLAEALCGTKGLAGEVVFQEPGPLKRRLLGRIEQMKRALEIARDDPARQIHFFRVASRKASLIVRQLNSPLGRRRLDEGMRQHLLEVALAVRADVDALQLEAVNRASGG